MSRSIVRHPLHSTTQRALVAERERVAKGLYKHSIHRLFGIGLKLQALSLQDGESAASRQLDDCVHELDLAIRDLREFVFDMGPRHV